MPGWTGYPGRGTCQNVTILAAGHVAFDGSLGRLRVGAGDIFSAEDHPVPGARF